MKNIILFSLVLAMYKTGTLAKHHIDDDNILAVMADTASIVLLFGTGVMVWFFF
jgi:hypothetical protein